MLRFAPETQLNAAVIKRHIIDIYSDTSRIISETVWSSNAFSLVGLPKGEYLLHLASLLSSTVLAMLANVNTDHITSKTRFPLFLIQ